jgi:hypothetical protein
LRKILKRSNISTTNITIPKLRKAQKKSSIRNMFLITMSLASKKNPKAIFFLLGFNPPVSPLFPITTTITNAGTTQ